MKYFTPLQAINNKHETKLMPLLRTLVSDSQIVKTLMERDKGKLKFDAAFSKREIQKFLPIHELSGELDYLLSFVEIKQALLEIFQAYFKSRGLALDVDYSLTLSCYDPDEQGRPCGRCDSCQLRAKGFAETAGEHLRKCCQ